MKKCIVILFLLFNTIIGMESEDPKKDLWQGLPKKKKKKNQMMQANYSQKYFVILMMMMSMMGK